MPVVNFKFQSVDATLTSGVIRVWSPELRPGGTAAITSEPSWVNIVDGKASMLLEPGPVVGKITGNGRTHGLSFTVPTQDDPVDFLDLLGTSHEYSPEVVASAQAAAREARVSAERAASAASRVGSAERVLQAEAAAKASESAAAGSATAAGVKADAAAASAVAAKSEADRAEGEADRAEGAADASAADVADLLDSKVAAADASKTAAASSATAASASATNCSASAIEAGQKASAAAGSATAAAGSAEVAEDHAQAAGAAQTGAEDARDAASSSASSAAGSATAASTSAAGAASAATNAANAVKAQLAADVTASEAARDAAQAAAASASTDAARAEAAAESASEAVNTGVADATATVKGKIQLAGDLGGTADSPTVPGLASKADRSTVDPVVAKVNSAATTGTADTLALRDGSGRLSVAAPTADGHAATKGYVDSTVSGTAVTLTGDQSVSGVKTFASTPTVGGVALVKNDDARLSDSRTPKTHTHTIVQVDGLDTALDGKLDSAKIQIVSALPSSPDANTIYLVTG